MRWKELMVVYLAATMSFACGDDEQIEQEDSIGEPAPDLAGRWRGTMDGSFGEGTVDFILVADGSLDEFESTVQFIRDCPLNQNTRWGVANERFTLSGRACNGTLVTLSAPYSTTRLTGTWEGQPSGNRGTFDVSPTGG